MTKAERKVRKYELMLHDKLAAEKKFIQHGRITCYEHSVNVAVMSTFIASKLPIVFNEASLIRGALLHDYFLYDWHDKDSSHRLHGFHHAGTALKNASHDFKINSIERDIISKHMFPLNLRPPKYRESWIVCLSDKICAVRETFQK